MTEEADNSQVSQLCRSLKDADSVKQALIHPNDTKKPPTYILQLLGKATAEVLVGLMMHIMIKHLQNHH